jgi:hypothetical protein
MFCPPLKLERQGDEGQTGLRIAFPLNRMMRKDRRVMFSDPAMTLFG